MLNLDRLQSWVDQGRINPSRPITLVQLYESGCVNSVGDGIKLLARVRPSTPHTEASETNHP
jgi:large subunit ribosomal protein L15